MLQFSKDRQHALVIQNRPALVVDVLKHFVSFKPDLVKVYPPAYFVALVDASIVIAETFRIDSVFSIRLFARLRWDVAPGFYREPRINAVLARKDQPADDRFSRLESSAYDEAWANATSFNGPHEWRAFLGEDWPK